jgi:hypothetical protein
VDYIIVNRPACCRQVDKFTDFSILQTGAYYLIPLPGEPVPIKIGRLGMGYICLQIDSVFMYVSNIPYS